MRNLLVLLCTVLIWSPLTQANQGKIVFKSEVAGSDLPFSDAVLTGNTLYISGKGGVIPGTRTVPDDPQEEARLLMEDFKATLARADMTMDDLVSVTIYCPDLSLYANFNAVYRQYFDGDFPPRAFVGSGPLLFGLRFEMQGIAVKTP
ncbi:MAG: Rid family hydrolase [Gammaproteobacteria bacterium]